MVSINANIASTLLGGTSSSDSFGISADVLTAWASARAGIVADAAAATQDPNAPLAPVWNPGLSPSAEALVQRALTNKAFFDVNAKLYSDLGATGDYQRLFALYSGLTTLQALAGRAEDVELSKTEQARTLAQFTRGMSELEAFFAQQQFENMGLAQGDRVDAAQTTLALATKSEDYITGIIQRGGLYEKVAGLANDAKFNIVATSLGGTVRNVAIDLSEMGSLPRSLSNVISFVNTKLSAAGAASRLEAVDQTPTHNTVMIGANPITTRYTGPKQYALKVDVRASERVVLEPVGAAPAFYALGSTASGARLIKLQDVSAAAGQAILLNRPSATSDPIGAYLASGWIGAGAPYNAPPANATEQRTNALVSTGANTMEDALRDAGEAVLKVELPDGRTLSVSTGWRSDDVEAWRTRAGETSDRAIVDDLAERLTQLLHEQGVAAGVDVWEDASGNLGFSVFTGDGVRASNLTISGKAAALATVEEPGMVGGLRDGVFARRFETGPVAAAFDLFAGAQTFVFTTATATHTIKIDGGTDGVDAATLTERLNLKLREKGISAAGALVNNAGTLTFRLDALHDMIDVRATLNEVVFDATLQAPGAWASGGLPNAGAGQPFGDVMRSYNVVGAPPLLTHADALDIEIVVATASGNKTINVAVTALERANNPDVGPGAWNAIFQNRLDAALNGVGVYVSASGGDLLQWSVAESAGQRLLSVTVNGDAQTLEGATPGFGLGGAFSAQRSFTGAQAATGVSDDVTELQADQNVSITFDTAWGERTIGATLEPGDPRTLESAALRLNQALGASGYDVGVGAVPLSGGGATLRVVTGGSNTVRGVTEINLGAAAYGATLDPIDAVSHADDPLGALRVYERASRGAAITETTGASTFTAPTANAAAWFPGRAFDVAVGGGAKVATARAVATAADGSVYVLADLSGDAANSAIKGARDVALLKYDSAGKLAFTEMLGASQSASGFALAVSADGKVAVAGAVEGALSGTSAKGGTDAFVTVFDANGKEVWTARRAATANDEALAISFAPDGSVIVAGKTTSALSGQVAMGGADGYVRGFSATGFETFTRQFGTGGADTATALLVRDNGAGGIDIFTGGVEDNRGVVRSFSYASATGVSAGATRDLGNFYKGEITALAADGASLYVGGATGADRLTLASTARGAVAAQEGFVARIDAGLVSTGLDRASYLGSAQDDAVKSIAIVNGEVYAAGVSGGVIAGAGSANSKTSFLARLDDDGDTQWVRTFSSAGGVVSLTALAVDPSGASPLDALGLPRGLVSASDPGLLTNRSALRVGDEFTMGVDGRRLTTIKIGENDTLASLASMMTRAINSAGRVEIVKEDGVERIKITARDGNGVRIEPGAEGRDALSALGLIQGVVATNTAGRGALKTYGLGLIAAELKLDSKDNVAQTKAEISAAISIVRQAYDALLNPNARELTEEEKALEARRQAAGPAPPYYANRLANYQAALARLTGG